MVRGSIDQSKYARLISPRRIGLGVYSVLVSRHAGKGVIYDRPAQGYSQDGRFDPRCSSIPLSEATYRKEKKRAAAKTNADTDQAADVRYLAIDGSGAEHNLDRILQTPMN